MIQEAFRDDVIRVPLKVDGPALPGAQQGNPATFQRHERVARSRGRHPRADDDGPRPCPGVEHRRVRGLTAVVGGVRCAND